MTQLGSIDDMPEDESTRKLIERAQEAWGRLRKSIVWDEWIVIGHALEAGSRDIMRHYQLNERIGAKWNKPWGEWLTKHGLDDIHKSARSYLLKIMDNYIEIEAWRRDVLSQADRVRLNHPQNVWSRFSSKRKGPNEDRRVNPLEVERDKLVEELHSAQEAIAEMETEITALRSDNEWHAAGATAEGKHAAGTVEAVAPADEAEIEELVQALDANEAEIDETIRAIIANRRAGVQLLQQERDEWKARALEAESRLEAVNNLWRPQKKPAGKKAETQAHNVDQDDLEKVRARYHEVCWGNVPFKSQPPTIWNDIDAMRAAIGGSAKAEKRQQETKKPGKKERWSEADWDYLVEIHNADFTRSNETLAAMCGDRFGRDLTTNMIKGALNRLRKQRRVPAYRPKAA